MGLPDITELLAEDERDPRSRDWWDKWQPEDEAWKPWVVDLVRAYQEHGIPMTRAHRRCLATVPGFPEVRLKAFCDGLQKRL